MRISDWSSDVCSSDLASQKSPLPLQACQKPASSSSSSGAKVSSTSSSSLSASSSSSSTVTSASRSEEHTSELQSLMRISYAVFCLKKKKNKKSSNRTYPETPKHIITSNNTTTQ